MPRRLSNMEWSMFLHDVDVDALDLPPWGGVVEWKGMNVLVYQGPTGEIFTTEVSDILPAVKANVEAEYNPLQQVWVYHLPQETMGVLAERAAQVTSAVSFALSPAFITGVAVLGLFLLTRK